MDPQKEELEPCYSCPHGIRIWHDLGGYESVVCGCERRNRAACSKCTNPGATIHLI